MYIYTHRHSSGARLKGGSRDPRGEPKEEVRGGAKAGLEGRLEGGIKEAEQLKQWAPGGTQWALGYFAELELPVILICK